jgi:hypothetical protein
MVHYASTLMRQAAGAHSSGENHSLFQFIGEFVNGLLIGEASRGAVRKENLDVVGLLDELDDMGDVYRFATFKLNEGFHAASVHETRSCLP